MGPGWGFGPDSSRTVSRHGDRTRYENSGEGFYPGDERRRADR